MTIEDIVNNYHYEKLSSKHDLSNFSCGVEDLDEFLKEDALEQQEKNLSVTYIAIYNNRIIGYVSILADKLECKTIKKKNGIYPYYPAVKIGRLAVDEKYKGLGLGNDILDTISIIIKKMSKKLGISFITVDAYCTARNFYSKNEFDHTKIHNPKKLKRTAIRNKTASIHMYKDIRKIQIEK